MDLVAMWDLVIRGILRGGLFASMAMGLSLVLGVMNISSFAHGEFLMIGAYIAYFFVEPLGLPPLLAILLAGLAGFVVGAVVERLIFYRMRRSTQGDEWVMNSFLVTVGLSFVLQNLVQALVGAKFRGIERYWEGSVYFFSDMGVSVDRVVAFGIALICIFALWLFLEKTRLGRAIRAASQDEAGAMLVGVKLDRIATLTFALSSMIGGISGASLLSMAPAFPTMGTLYTTKSWFVVIIAGLGNVGGAIPAAFIVGLLETVFYYFIGQGWQDVPSLGFLVLILLLKPQGLFGSAVKGKLEQ
jgi:branched-chain amino acid transport system permease protein